ncbi:MAG: hypothetical protein D6723_08635 [Acidobacteria bacterium]|nr:MAG: hypothetical protein D6723_08635 [Acidobacteriota bacterium]
MVILGLCLLLSTIVLELRGASGKSNANSTSWVWLEAEAFAKSNFPHASYATRGLFCRHCSGRECLLFLPGRKGRPFDPPGDLAYAYPDPERQYAPTLPTLRRGGVREGLDDLRYLSTLEQALAVVRGDLAKTDAVAHAEALLAELRADLNRYGPEARGIIAYFEAEDYTRYRWKIAQAIMELLGLSP